MIPERKPFALPMMTILGCRQDDTGKHIAHALDFDIVCVGQSEQEAIDKIRLSLTAYIEFGLSNGWNDDIVFHAPQEFWDKLSVNTPIRLMDPIYVQDKRVPLAYVTVNVPTAAEHVTV